MKDYGVSRKERFSTEEPYLKALPVEKFQLFNWKTAKVHPDLPYSSRKEFYSVPFQYVGKKKSGKAFKELLKLFYTSGELLSTHKKN